VSRLLLVVIASVVAAGCGGTTNSLPYRKVVFTVSDAQHAFASEGVHVMLKSQGPQGTTLGDSRDVFEVDIFGDPAVLRHDGFHDLPHGPDCAVAGHLALQWRDNVRAVLNCRLVHNRRAWIAKMDLALAALR
jgi:hypothetical protein